MPEQAIGGRGRERRVSQSGYQVYWMAKLRRRLNRVELTVKGGDNDGKYRRSYL